jgi:hypothetical protein
MNAILKSHKILSALLFAICLLVSTDSIAHGGWDWHGRWHHGWGGWGGGVYIGPSYNHPYYYSNCGWVSGHWQDEYWIPAHRVCWY